ncbi:MAG: CPBP family intramembrane glutamic endopeptidase [Pyrinomonadaceae bacterium]
MNVKVRLFLILLAAGLTGVISFLLVDLEALLAMQPLPAGTDMPMSIPMLKLLSLIQPAVLVAVAAVIGVGLASRVGLRSPVAEAVASRRDVPLAIKSQLVPGIIGGLAGGVSIVLISAILKPFLTAEIFARLGEWGNILPLPVRLLYGGITEEVLLRWGMMTLLVWAAWRLFQKGQDRPRPVIVVAAILLSSLTFALGHMPIAFLLFPEPTLPLILFVIFGNSTFGLIAGWLYWKKGLESAMIAHMIAHVVMFAASYLGAYF